MGIQVIHSMQDPYDASNRIEVFCEVDGGEYEFRLVKDSRVLHQSERLHCNSALALRDALVLYTSDAFVVPA